MTNNLFDTLEELRLTIEPLSLQKRAKVINALLLYAKNGEIPELKKDERVPFMLFSRRIDAEKRKLNNRKANMRKISAIAHEKRRNEKGPSEQMPERSES